MDPVTPPLVWVQWCITVQTIVLGDREKCVTNRYWVQNVRRERKLPYLNLVHGWRMIVSVRKLVTQHGTKPEWFTGLRSKVIFIALLTRHSKTWVSLFASTKLYQQGDYLWKILLLPFGTRGIVQLQMWIYYGFNSYSCYQCPLKEQNYFVKSIGFQHTETPKKAILTLYTTNCS